MRALALLLLCVAAACAGQPRSASRADCLLEENGVVVTMNSASWHRLLVADSEPVAHGTHLALSYVLNLDPDPMADQRTYIGLADHARLSVTFGRQFPIRLDRSRGYLVQMRSDGIALARPRNGYGQAVFAGSDLDTLLGGAGDVEILLLDRRGQVLRREHLTRNELSQVDASMRTLATEMRRRLVDPARFCAPEETIVVV